jgi:hypothetical protein
MGERRGERGEGTSFRAGKGDAGSRRAGIKNGIIPGSK